jgi:multiple sugar transport system permease protein
VDGAGFWKKLRHVTIPLLRPSLTISTVLNIIYVFNSFPIVYTITKGAPAHKTDTMVTFLYMLAYAEQEMGAATALSVIGFLILAVVAGAYMMISMRKEEAR